MIKINRSVPELKVTELESKELLRIRALNKTPTKKELGAKYKGHANALWMAQHCKCCYCEAMVFESFNDVEHYRPKLKAIRSPGVTLNHGYWWLAFNWDNLLFACPGCNRSGKNAAFPLAIGSVALFAESLPPGAEVPLLIDPAGTVNPIEHIQFIRTSIKRNAPEKWRAVPRNNSVVGTYTIRVCKLNRDELLETREAFYESVLLDQISAIREELADNNLKGIKKEFRRAKAMLRPNLMYAALAYDVFCREFPSPMMHLWLGEDWPLPADACL